MLFLGQFPLSFRPHRVVQERLVVCLEGYLRLRLPGGNRLRAQSCLLGNGLILEKGLVDARDAVIAVFCMAPFSQDYPSLACTMETVFPRLSVRHPLEQPLIRRLTVLRDSPSLSPADLHRALMGLIIPPLVSGIPFREYDHRIIEVATRIQACIGENLPLSELAGAVNLSDSRLEKLFKEQSGIPITQFRLRYRVFISIILLGLGYSVTEAALIAGFSSSAHFSRSFSAIIGLAPSTTFLKPPFLQTFIDDEVQRTIAPMTERHPV